MELFVDKEGLEVLTSKLEQEIDKYKNYIYNFYKELDSLSIYWSGNRYQLFMEEVDKNRTAIENSYQNLAEYSDLIHSSLNNYISLSEGVHYRD